MKFNYEEKKQLIQLAKLMREGSKLYPIKITGVLFGNEGEACALGCVIAASAPHLANKMHNADGFDYLKEEFPVLSSIHENYSSILTWIWSMNDGLNNPPVLKIADNIEALTYEEIIS